MTDPTPITDADGFSIASLARHLRMSRDTVAARLKACQVKPCGERNGYAVYPLREAAEALLERTMYASGERPDPADLKPMERRAWYQSENERLKFETESGQLVPANEVTGEMAAIAKIVTQNLDAMADVAERDFHPPPEIVQFLQKLARDTRLRIYEAMRGDPAADGPAA